MDEEKIKKQAKDLMDEFMKELSKLQESGEEFGSERNASLRNAKSSKKAGFKEKALKNAPKTKDNYFVMEKKKW